MGKFKLYVDNFSWINERKDDPKDLCLHGHATAIIGNTKLEYTATVSAAALCLLRSITENHIINEDTQMFPCCGHTLIPNEDLSEVYIIGCDCGIDWTVLHENERIKIILEHGETIFVDLHEYRNEIFQFADQLEKYYKSCSPKILPKDEFDKNGYLAFWNEWYRRRNADK